MFTKILAALVIIAGLFAFYWFAFMPSQVKIKCAKLAEDVRFAERANLEPTSENIKRTESTALFEYNMCLHENGL